MASCSWVVARGAEPGQKRNQGGTAWTASTGSSRDRGTLRSPVWDAVADPAGLSAWLDAEVEAQLAGGPGSFRFADGELRRAMVQEVVPGRELTFSWWEIGGPATTVTITVEPVPAGGSRVRFREVGPRAAPGPRREPAPGPSPAPGPHRGGVRRAVGSDPTLDPRPARTAPTPRRHRARRDRAGYASGRRQAPPGSRAGGVRHTDPRGARGAVLVHARPARRGRARGSPTRARSGTIGSPACATTSSPPERPDRGWVASSA